MRMAGFPARKQKNWKTEGQKRRITRKEYQRLLSKTSSKWKVSWQKGLWNLAGEKLLQDRGKERTREEENDENETVSARRRCVGSVSFGGL